MSADQATSTTLQALQTLYHDPDPAAKKRANEWLEEFQHGILYDLSQLPRDALASLRDSILASVVPLSQPGAPAGSRAVVTQLCLALADLALQMPEWAGPVGETIERFGTDPGTVVLLLKFLGSLAEESCNSRLPGSDYIIQLLGDAAPAVLQVLSMYIGASGITSQIQISVFETVSSWLRSGELPVASVAQSPLFDAMFAALPSDELFDAAVDVICDLIHETQEVDDAETSAVVRQIVGRLIALRPELEVHRHDPDRVRGYCRMFCEAGECNQDIIRQHPTEVLPLVEAIMACTAYPDLEIVPITFQFWYILSGIVNRNSGLDANPEFQPYFAIFAQLQATIIGHLHFPPDGETQTAQERDDFRSFRHRMGDTLKDCCQVLGAPACLRQSYDLVVAAMSKPTPSWQQIEAPLFSMRSMGAEVDPNDDEVMPHIMELLPKLPDHPKIRYAAILVISRYTEWIDRHPDNISFQLQYISAGFDASESSEVSAAAAQAMKYMCQDCNRHLVPYLPQLHAFVTTVADRLDQTDMVEVCEAIGYVILSHPADQAAAALQQFCDPLITRIQAVAAMPQAQKPDLQRAADALEQVDAYLRVIRTLNPVPESCYPTAATVFAVLDTLLARYASVYFISERVGSLLRRGLTFFPSRALEPVVQPLLARMASAFEQTGYASYVWIIGKVVDRFAAQASAPGGDQLAALLVHAFEGTATALQTLLQSKAATQIPDVMDDYAHCFHAYLPLLARVPAPTLSLAVSHLVAALLCPASQIIMVALDALAALARPPLLPLSQPVLATYAAPALSLILGGIVRDFPEDAIDPAREIVGAVVVSVGQDAERLVTDALASIPGNVLPVADKQAFLADLQLFLADPSATDRIRNGVNGLVRAARRARERGRQARKSLGAV
ncbi:Nuclear import receptor [Cryptotrichosporon argae]